MAYLALDRADTLARSDSIRLALGNEAGAKLPRCPTQTAISPISRSATATIGTSYAGGGQKAASVRFLASGDTLIVTGDASDEFYACQHTGILARFRHQHFLMFLIAHFQKAALHMFSDRLVAAVSRLDIMNAKANRIFRRDIRNAHENFLRFAHRYWFHHISHQAQMHELFEKTRGHLRLDALYSEVREELQDMGSFLDVEAMRKQNETVVRLTVVTTFGLVGTVTTGFIGMNLFDWTQQPTWWRVLAFLCGVPADVLSDALHGGQVAPAVGLPGLTLGRDRELGTALAGADARVVRLLPGAVERLCGRLIAARRDTKLLQVGARAEFGSQAFRLPSCSPCGSSCGTRRSHLARSSR